eukprot:scaffold580195_cov45-Prasinocladus_malaysianus.AAC.2
MAIRHPGTATWACSSASSSFTLSRVVHRGVVLVLWDFFIFCGWPIILSLGTPMDFAGFVFVQLVSRGEQRRALDSALSS